MRAWASESAHPSMAGATIFFALCVPALPLGHETGATIGRVGPVVCVSLSRLFPEILSGFWWAVAVVIPGFGHRSKQAFSCLIALGHPSPVVGR